jgi:hypothetical protein
MRDTFPARLILLDFIVLLHMYMHR